MNDFLAVYDDERKRRFNRDERVTLWAALAYGAAYTARCEHSDRCTAMGTAPAQTLPRETPTGSRAAFLKDHATELLDRPVPVAD